ncbi:MAG: DISARM system helicase DrmA [Polyangiaceae bacterium]
MNHVTAPRTHLVHALEADLIGPFRRGLLAADGKPGIDATEELSLPPSRWYLTGFLAPEEGREEEEDAQEELAVGNDETEEDTGGSAPEPKKKNFLPASIGITVFVPASATHLDATVRYATYDKVNEEPSRKDKARKIWKRVPMPAVTERLVIADLSPKGVSVPDSSGLRLAGQMQRLVGIKGVVDGTQAVSVFLVNRRPPDESPAFRDRGYVFQVELSLDCADGLVARPDRSGEGGEADDQIADLQYRGSFEYGVGHGIAVEVPEGQAPVRMVRSTWVPCHEVRRVIARSAEKASVTVAMEKLAALESAEEVIEHLHHLPENYAEWIAEQRKIALDSDDRRDAQSILLDKAANAAERIRAGIALICAHDDIREAFCLANRAMAMAARKKRPDEEPSWRLFQLAFVLLNLRSIAEPTHDDRKCAELIFFPTGGGKTEAYLGVIAFTLVLRRLRARNESHAGLGVAVILRYTLRLLTLDQLGRAASLICALESLRRKAPTRLGAERFTVGLWVGSSATSNTMVQVQKEVTQFQTGSRTNPAPLTDCPWCATELTPGSLTLLLDGKPTSRGAEEVRIACPNDKCEFCAANHADGIPVLFVDEHLYRELPSFLIGTVDKFAMVPWRGETGKLFGKVTGRAGRRFFNRNDCDKLPKGAIALPKGILPPELIVQDELHLISGPLGTMVGLYETAVDFLSRREIDGKSVGPKVIAATATVRRATEQMQALYGRRAAEVCVFPPPAVDAMDTYFSLVDPDPQNPGRLYLGVAAPGKSLKAILVRVYRALLAASAHAHADENMPRGAADATTTLAGYFNSLRELGGMRRIVEDELRARAGKSEDFHPLDFTQLHPWFKNRKLDSEPVELTSRETTDKIKHAKDRLHEAYENGEHVDVLLASNMISVGVDIDRLGLMVVAGQPKTTAEYIQASSRVGRQVTRPGLVVTCMNVHKARDRSHYERFAHYHQSFYRHVEATSVTPFSGPALDRGMAGTFVAMARFCVDALTPANGVMLIEQNKAAVADAADALAERAARQPGQSREQEDALVQSVRKRAQNLLETWEQLMQSTAEEPVKRVYSRFDKDKPGGAALLRHVLDDNPPPKNSPEGRFFAPTSMRDVEDTAHLWVQKALGPYEGKAPKGGA